MIVSFLNSNTYVSILIIGIDALNPHHWVGVRASIILATASTDLFLPALIESITTWWTELFKARFLSDLQQRGT